MLTLLMPTAPFPPTCRPAGGASGTSPVLVGYVLTGPPGPCILQPSLLTGSLPRVLQRLPLLECIPEVELQRVTPPPPLTCPVSGEGQQWEEGGGNRIFPLSLVALPGEMNPV